MKNQTIKSLNILGQQISSAWDSKNRDIKYFSKIARVELEKNNVSNWFSKLEIMKWFLHTNQAPTQQSPVSGFGEPPITVYEEEDFFIEVYFWNSPLISIHDHAFSGAFTVIEGASLNCEYQFNIKKKLKGQTHLGSLQLKKIEHLSPGSVREIRSGNSFIHDVWHYIYPTISIVVRTKRERKSQFVYHQNMAADTLYNRDPHFQRKLALLEHILIIDPDQYWEEIKLLLGKNDLYSTFIIYCDINQDPRKLPFVKKLNKLIKQNSDNFLEPLDKALKHIQIVSEVYWPEIQSRETRLLVSLLLIKTNKAQFFEIFEQVFKKESRIYLKKALNELKATGAAGSILNQKKFSEIYQWLRD